jgi:hypothetical protein
MGIPTHEDAKLLIEVFRLRMEPPVQEAERWFFSEFQPGPWHIINARYPLGSPGRLHLARVLSYWEMVGALVDHNLLNEDLLFDMLENMNRFWERLQEWLPAARAAQAVEEGENIERLVNRQQRWKKTQIPKSDRL